ncbi:MAG: OmpA family protein, partial [Chitinophagaceae bacterium]
LRVKIIGHSSADGNDALNLVLSQKRALAVKDALVNEWGIDAGRIETDGKGSTEPIDRTNTPTGNALNRRVEFIKL